MHFVWDPKKVAANQRNHGVTFEEVGNGTHNVLRLMALVIRWVTGDSHQSLLFFGNTMRPCCRYRNKSADALP